MNRKWLTIENSLYTIAFILGLVLRWLNLGVFPLSDAEASWALQALSLSRAEVFSAGPQPAFIALTSFIFTIFGSSNALARLWPALAGGLLVFFPIFFRNKFGRTAALVMAFGLALDPGLVALSRQAGGPMAAISFTVLALGSAYSGASILTGVLGGLALLSGPAVIHGMLGLFLTWLVVRALNLAQLFDRVGEHGVERRPRLLQGLLALVATILIAGTLFFRFPNGLSAWMGTLPAYFSTWLTPSGVPALRLGAALLVYQPLAVIFGVIGGVRHWRDKSDFVPHFGLWFVVAFLLALIYPARQVSDIAWAIIPLWGLAAMEISAVSTAEREQRWIYLGQAGLMFLLLALFWLNLAGLVQPVANAQAYTLRLAVMAGLLALIILTAVLIGLGWSWQTARIGVIIGLCAALGTYMLATIWSASQLNAYRQPDLWVTAPTTGDADLLSSTVGDLSEWNFGLRESIDLAVAVDSPALRWLFRDFDQVNYLSGEPVLPAGESPSVVIIRQTQEEPSLSASYRGQDFVWWVSPGWQGALPADLTGWLTARKAPLNLEHVILWARADLFPGGSAEPANDFRDDLAPEDGDFP